MKSIKIKIFFAVIVVLILGVVLTVASKSASQTVSPGKYDTFATCLKDKGSIFYGAFWCPHCNNTKAAFGSSKSLLPYVECSTPDGKGQEKVCKDKGIMGYPTWEFVDGSRLTGEVSLEKLAEKTSCVLPQ